MTKSIGKLLIAVVMIYLLAPLVQSRILRAVYPVEYADLVTRAETEHTVPRNLILAVMREESHFRSDSISKASAVGLMQLLPKTAEWIAAQRHIAYDKHTLSTPEINIDYGSWYIHYLTQQLHDDTLSIEAYNAGITNVLEWEHNKPGYVAFAETDQFVKRVEQSRMIYDQVYGEKWQHI